MRREIRRRENFLPVPAGAPRCLLGDIRGLIEFARTQTAQAVNAGLVTL